MKRARVYYFFAFLMAIGFVLTLYHRITIVFFAAVVILPVISYLLMLLNYAFIKFEVSVDKKIYEKKEQSSTLIRIANEGILPAPFVKIKLIQIDKNGKSADENIYAFSIPPLRRVDFQTNIMMKRRGMYQVGIKEVEVYDMFGLFKFKRTINIIEEILVLPKRILLYGNMTRNIIAEDGDEKSKSKIGEDRTIISHIRDYVEGDNVNSVHWKLSSKKDDLIVKVYDHPNDNNIMIIADMQAHEFEDSDLWEDSGDAVVETALALAMKCVYDGKSCTLYWYDTLQSCIVWYNISTFSEFNTAFNHLAVSRVSFDDVTAETILKNQEICDTHNEIIYVINQGLDINTADILSALAAFDDNEINCICFDFKNLKETDDFINELTLANVNIAKFSGGEYDDYAEHSGIEGFLNNFIQEN